MAWYNRVWKYAYTKPNEYLFGRDNNVDSRKLADENLKGRSPWTNTTGRQWHELVQNQRAAALGQGPSLAQQQYRQAMGDTQAALQSAGRASGRPGAMRAAMQQQANLGQGMASGLMQAGLQERQQAEQSYMAGLQGATAVEASEADTWMELLRSRMNIPTSPNKFDRFASVLPYLSMLSKNKQGNT